MLICRLTNNLHTGFSTVLVYTETHKNILVKEIVSPETEEEKDSSTDVEPLPEKSIEI